mmetsp:Transcript_110743/g.264181  ORF Transcript_110743/g.264181 Transcript_110743/m.264181 type:complete len:201 (+) Transcript_110743:1016-1618(+)
MALDSLSGTRSHSETCQPCYGAVLWSSSCGLLDREAGSRRWDYLDCRFLIPGFCLLDCLWQGLCHWLGWLRCLGWLCWLGWLGWLGWWVRGCRWCRSCAQAVGGSPAAKAGPGNFRLLSSNFRKWLNRRLPQRGCLLCLHFPPLGYWSALVPAHLGGWETSIAKWAVPQMTPQRQQAQHLELLQGDPARNSSAGAARAWQ